MVAIRSRIFASDEELGKRDDDHKPKKTAPMSLLGSSNWHRRRIVVFLVGCILVGLFIYNIPQSLGPHPGARPNYGRKPTYGRMPAENPRGNRALSKEDGREYVAPVYTEEAKAPAAESRRDAEPAVPTGQTYQGPVRFYNLASSLHNIANIVDFRQGNRHVLFAASDLNTAAALIPIACEMANWRRNTVHFAVMGRDEMPIDEIMEINGAVYQQCPIYWHDARPDSAAISTDSRMELSVAGAFGHFKTYMLPQAVITADSAHENVYFVTGATRAIRSMDWTHIEIPKEDPELLGWMPRLDAGSLQAWHSASLDILVQAPLESSGSLIRLLTSLEKADYTAFTPPRLTIELPHKLDLATQNFLTGFKWPPRKYAQGQGQDNQLIIRRRISEQYVGEEEASRRFIESFYPASPRGPHVLLLSPQVELSPAYFHYLKAHILEYKNSYDRPVSYRNMMGISLETPSIHLNASAEFEVPQSESSTDEDDNASFMPFRWQAPNANAALYFSDKWIELHSFLTKRRTATLHSLTKGHHARKSKLISEKQPAWMEYMLDLMQVRGYWLHYPGLFFHGPLQSTKSSGRSVIARSEESLVVVHNELYQPPEEFNHAVREKEEVTKTIPKLPSDTVLPSGTDYLSSHHPVDAPSNFLNDERPLIKNIHPLMAPLMMRPNTDPHSLDKLPEPATVPLPHLSRTTLLDPLGVKLDNSDLIIHSNSLRRLYRQQAGGCSEEQSKDDTNVQPGSADDLFCLPQDTGIEPLSDREVTTEIQTPPKPTSLTPLRSGIIHGSDGAAAVINRVVDAEKYQETARAGFEKKLAAAANAKKGDKIEYLAPVNAEERTAFTDEEKNHVVEAHKATPPKKLTSGLQQIATSERTEADLAAPQEAAEEVQRDAPLLEDTHSLAPGQTYEEQMAARDAVKKDAMNERARAGVGVGAGAGVPVAGNLGKMRMGDENDPEILVKQNDPATKRRNRASSDVLKVGEDGMPLTGAGTDATIDAAAADAGQGKEKEKQNPMFIGGGNLPGKTRMRVLEDEDADGSKFVLPKLDRESVSEESDEVGVEKTDAEKWEHGAAKAMFVKGKYGDAIVPQVKGHALPMNAKANKVDDEERVEEEMGGKEKAVKGRMAGNMRVLLDDDDSILEVLKNDLNPSSDGLGGDEEVDERLVVQEEEEQEEEGREGDGNEDDGEDVRNLFDTIVPDVEF